MDSKYITMKQQDSILVILPWFGKLPSTFHFWLQSCAENTTVDFLIVTDQHIDTSAYSNIKLLNSSLSDVSNRASELLGIHVDIKRAYKLCDFKPVLGWLFAEYTREYDFWGFCDCDLIFGDIRKFLSDEVLSSHDYILCMGHFHLSRTLDEKLKEVLFSAKNKQGLGWQEIFTSPQNHCFDELPCGIPARYLDLYPDRVFTGFAENGRCFESCDPRYVGFVDTYNSTSAYKQSMYKSYSQQFPFWKRNKGDSYKHVIYRKQGIKLYKVGKVGGVICEKEILYAHFYKIKLKVRTQVLADYLIVPYKIIKSKATGKYDLSKTYFRPIQHLRLCAKAVHNYLGHVIST